MNQVAQTILSQLGGNRFVAMTGAKMFVYGENFLQFKLPARFAKDGINHIRVTLTEDDLYDIEFGKARGINFKVVSEAAAVYADQMREVFKSTTGLDTALR